MLYHLEDRCQSRNDFEVNTVTGGRLLFYSGELICSGYVDMKLDGFYRSRYSVRDTEIYPRHGPAICGVRGHSASEYDYRRYKHVKTLSLDIFLSIRCTKWPAIAKPWITRWRPSGWPGVATIKVIVNGGGDLVHVAHRDCRPNDDQ